jgi:hypothetical protein
MKAKLLALFLSICAAIPASALVEIDLDVLGNSLGGWKARKGRAAEYEISEAIYRTYQPETSPSPDGGIFVSIRIDHVRGFMASDDYASLELSFAADGTLVTAQSSLALQGRTISSELIKGGASASTSVAAPYVDRAVKIGTDLVADLSSKLLREKIVEPGRVSFPAAIRHNYNLIYKAVRVKPDAPAIDPTMPANTTGAKPPESLPEKPAPAPPAATPAEPEKKPEKPVKPGVKTVVDASTKKEVPLPDIHPYNGNGAPTTPLPQKDKSAMMQVGSEVLKTARDVVKQGMK